MQRKILNRQGNKTSSASDLLQSDDRKIDGQGGERYSICVRSSDRIYKYFLSFRVTGMNKQGYNNKQGFPP